MSTKLELSTLKVHPKLQKKYPKRTIKKSQITPKVAQKHAQSTPNVQSKYPQSTLKPQQ